MEVLHKGSLAVEEQKVELIGDEDGVLGKKHIDGNSPLATSMPLTSEANDEIHVRSKEQMLKSAREEMGKIKEENERLRTVLSRITKDYEYLHSQFITITQHQHKQDQNKTTVANMDIIDGADEAKEQDTSLLSLSLGTTMNTKNSITNRDKDGHTKTSGHYMGSGDLSLSLQSSSKLEGSTSSGDRSFDDEMLEKKEEGGGELWKPNKLLKKNPRSEDHEISQQLNVKKARVSVRARCDAPTMNDGCQWRKYGQKISKGNPCPRAYYRCTVAPSCPVRKQVQRCVEDMSILVTTYEGTHNHPLPAAATSMASTTSAAASMLLSPSTSSNASPLPSTNLNFTISQPSSYFHHLSTTPSHTPTITLDLTSPSPQFNTNNPNLSSYPSLASGYFNRFTSNFYNPNYTNNKNPSVASYLPKHTSSQQEALTDTLAKAITSDPSFKSALASAITSIVGGEGSGDAKDIHMNNSNNTMGNHSSRLSSVLVADKLGYLQSSSPLAFLGAKSSPSTENRGHLNL